MNTNSPPAAARTPHGPLIAQGPAVRPAAEYFTELQALDEALLAGEPNAADFMHWYWAPLAMLQVLEFEPAEIEAILGERADRMIRFDAEARRRAALVREWPQFSNQPAPPAGRIHPASDSDPTGKLLAPVAGKPLQPGDPYDAHA